MTREPGEMKLGPTKAWSKGASLTPMAVQTGGGRYSALLNDEGSFLSRPSATNIRLGPPRPFGYRVVPTKLQKTVQATRIFTQSWRKKASRKSSLSQQGAADPTTEHVPFQAKSDIKGKPDRTEDEIQRKTDGIMNEFLSSGDLQNVEIAIVRQLKRLICESPKVTTVSSFMQWLFLNNFKKIDAEVKLYVLVHVLYVKAVEEQIYTPKYAEVCKLIFETEIPSASGTGIIRFRKFLLDRFQQTFEKQKKFEEEIISNQKAQLEADTEEKKKKIEMELDKRKGISKHIMLGNISFFGELFKLKIVTVEIVNFYISELLKSPTEEQLECLSKFISIIGKAYEKEYPWMEMIKEVIFEGYFHQQTSPNLHCQD
ncbi:eukaryotic translation initiation factor 4 gamma 3-like [Artemia franciscana]|uniref:eukaryotic translation initiation factor 4 gamma 3-like n=1 Tax=Artemia franciscana TaxID=6661 RepID=UPI0032DA52E3